MKPNNACNCCNIPTPPFFFFGYKDKIIKSKFCPTNFKFLTAPYQQKAAGTLTPSDPPNPESGPLFSGLSVSYSDSSSSVYENPNPVFTGGSFFAPICSILIESSSSNNISASYVETATENKIKSNDLYRDEPSEQLCSNICGSPNNPILQGSSNSNYFSSSKFKLNNPPQFSNVTVTDSETFNSSVNGCRENNSYPSAQGTYNRTQTRGSDGSYNFICGGVRYTTPSPNPTITTTSAEYNVVNLPFNLDKTTTTAIDDLDIKNVIDEASNKLNDVEYYAPEGEDYFWNSESIQTKYSIFSSPFSESGFANFAEVTLSEKEYILRISAPTVSCYVKVWIVEEFLPQEPPEDWPKNLDGSPKPERISTLEIEHNFQEGDVIDGTCYQDENINFTGQDGLSFVPENSILLTESPIKMEAPEKKGTKTLKILKYSFLENYIPDDPDSVPYCNPNGFPNPELCQQQ